MSSDFASTLRKLKPDKHRAQLKPRAESELAFVDLSVERPRSLMYDTTVYIDILQGRFPNHDDLLLRTADAWHSTVAEQELASTCALLDPGHRETKNVISRISEIIGRISPHRCLAPDRQVWHEAGILTGTIARIQGNPKTNRRRILNDALIFATARKHGHTVLTRNTTDFDFLQQLDPSGRAVFYRV